MKKILASVIGGSVVLVGVLVSGWPVGLVKVAGGGMGENNAGRTLAVNKMAYVMHDPKRGDVVVYKGKIQPGIMEIARVWGVPGDKIETIDGQIVVNGQRPEGTSPIVDKAGKTVKLQEVLNTGEYFVMGDNRPVGINIDIQGVVGREEILGKVWFN